MKLAQTTDIIFSAKFASVVNKTAYCNCGPKCERVKYGVTKSNAQISKHTSRVHALNGDVPLLNIDEIRTILGWSIVDYSWTNSASFLTKLSHHMYELHLNLTNVDEIASQLVLIIQDPVLEDIVLNIKNRVQYILKWMTTTYMYSFTYDPSSVLNFNIRVTDDLIHFGNKTINFLNDLERLYDGIDTKSLNTSSALNDNSTILQKDILNNLYACKRLFPIVRYDLVNFNNSIIRDRFPELHNHYIRGDSFYQ